MQPIDHKKLLSATGIALVGAVLLYFAGLVSLSSTIARNRAASAVLIEKNRPYTPDDYRKLVWKKVETPTPWEKRDSAEAYIWNNTLYMFGGLNADDTHDANGMPQYDKARYFNDIWKSTDGEHWELVVEHSDLPAIRSMSILPFNDALYLIAGRITSNDLNESIWKSTDGVHWEKVVKKVAFPGREGQRVLEHDGKLYMFGGVDYNRHIQYNDVWVSSDALTWTPLTRNAPWHGRWDHDVGYMNGAFWLANGMSSITTGYDDLWKSPDGISWTLVSNDTGLGKRQGQSIVHYRNTLWLVGGLDTSSNAGVGDTWFLNGDHWEKTTQDGGWIGREDHLVLPFKGKLWLFTGMGSDWHWTNDIWYAELTR